MQQFPHVYSVTSTAGATSNLALTSEGLPRLTSAAPAEFGGPGDQWSPETLLAAAIASCFVLSFRFVARRLRLEWVRLECEVEATLERVGGGVTRFTQVVIHATLTAPGRTGTAAYEDALLQAEHGCLVANSLACTRELRMEIVRAPREEMLPQDLASL
jgi:organic hydroperoxide reductase OsmC/OhrA